MAIIYWGVAGLVCGFLPRLLGLSVGRSLPVDIVLAMVGAVAGGLLFNVAMATEIGGVSVWDAAASFVVALAVVLTFHRVVGKRPI